MLRIQRTSGKSRRGRGHTSSVRPFQHAVATLAFLCLVAGALTSVPIAAATQPERVCAVAGEEIVTRMLRSTASC